MALAAAVVTMDEKIVFDGMHEVPGATLDAERRHYTLNAMMHSPCVVEPGVTVNTNGYGMKCVTVRGLVTNDALPPDARDC